jgi:hypothetical protein
MDHALEERRLGVERGGSAGSDRLPVEALHIFDEGAPRRLAFGGLRRRARRYAPPAAAGADDMRIARCSASHSFTSTPASGRAAKAGGIGT